MKHIHRALGLLLVMQFGLNSLTQRATIKRSRNERGLSQSTENAILLAGAVTIAVLVITVVGSYVSGKLPR